MHLVTNPKALGNSKHKDRTGRFFRKSPGYLKGRYLARLKRLSPKLFALSYRRFRPMRARIALRIRDMKPFVSLSNNLAPW